jgi:hypothetical protein
VNVLTEQITGGVFVLFHVCVIFDELKTQVC